MFYLFNVISLVVAVIDSSDLKNTIWFFIGSYPFMLNFKLQHVLDECTPYALEGHWLGFFFFVTNYERPSNCNTVMFIVLNFGTTIIYLSTLPVLRMKHLVNTTLRQKTNGLQANDSYEINCYFSKYCAQLSMFLAVIEHKCYMQMT